MIDRDHEVSLTRQAELLGISRGSAYYLPRPVPDSDLALMRRIDELHLEHPFMGPRLLRGTLNREGFRVVRRHVATLTKPSTGVPGPARSIRATRSIPTCCAAWPSTGRMRSGPWT